MIELAKKILFLVAICTNTLLVAQTKDKEVGEIAEIVFPSTAEIKDNFTLYYEVHLDNTEIPQPSFWYKIIFGRDGSFDFTMFPLDERDKYDFYLFKVNANEDYCEALKYNKVLSYNPKRIYRVYDNREQSEEFRAGLVEVRSTPIKAGDAIYLEVFNTVGKDCGHILDFRTDSSSFVVKTINDNCDSNTYKMKDSTLANLSRELIPPYEALTIFDSIFCKYGSETRITSLQFSNGGMSVNNNIKLSEYKALEIPERRETTETADDTLDDYFEPVPRSRPIRKRVKSTADLNKDTDSIFYRDRYGAFLIDTEDGVRNNTRLEVDKVLFTLLEDRLKKNNKEVRDQLSHNYQVLKKTKNKSNRKEVVKRIKSKKKEKAFLQQRLRNVKNKIYRIDRLLADQRKNGVRYEETIFSKSLGETMPTVSREGLIYRVQIGAYKNLVDKTIFKGLSPIYADSFSGGIRYSVGAFRTLEDARQAKEYVVNTGLSDAFVVIYLNGKRITLSQAKEYEMKY